MSNSFRPQPASSQVHSLSFENAGKGVQAAAPVMNKDDALHIRLPQNPTTGYLWVVSSAPAGIAKSGYPTSDGDMDESDYHYEPSISTDKQKQEQLVGAGGHQTIQFRAVDDVAVNDSFVLRHKRTWLPDSEEDALLVLTVRACLVCEDKGYVYTQGSSVIAEQTPCPEGCGAAISYLGREHAIKAQSDDQAQKEMSGQLKEGQA